MLSFMCTHAVHTHGHAEHSHGRAFFITPRLAGEHPPLEPTAGFGYIHSESVW
jgi:hypothetical protein